MTFSLVSDSTSPARTLDGKKYGLLDVTELHNAINTENLEAHILETEEGKAIKSISGHRTRCRLMDAHGVASDQKERALAATKLKTAIAISVAFMVLEIVGGCFAGSLAVLADAAHMLSDVAGFAISLLALGAAGWLATPHHTFGFFRLEVLGALVSVQIIWVMTGVIVYEACQKLYYGNNSVDGRVMFSVALVGLVMNLVMIFVLGHGHDCDNGGHWHGHSHCTGKGDNHRHGNRQEPECCNGHGNGYSRYQDKNQSHPHNHDTDVEVGQGHRHKSGCCNDSHEKHLHHEEHHLHKHTHIAELDLDNGDERVRNIQIFNNGLSCVIRSLPIDEKQGEGGHLLSSSQLTPSDHMNELEGGLHCVDIHPCYEQNVDSPACFDCCHGGKDASVCEDKSPRGAEALRSMRNGIDDAFALDKEDVMEADSQAKVGLLPKDLKTGTRNINLRGAYLHALGDLIQNIGVLISGLVIWVKPEWKYIDLVCSILFSVLVMMTTMRMVKDIVWVLMESASRDLDVAMLKKGLMQVPGVSDVVDLHVWALTPGTDVLSCHIEIKPGAVAKNVLHSATDYCVAQHGIKHVTIQIEEVL